MSSRRPWVAAALVSGAVALFAFAPIAAHSLVSGNYTFASPVFGITTAADGSLLVADAGAGIVRLHRGQGKLIAPLPGVTDVAQTFFSLFAITGGGPDPTSAKLYRVVHGTPHQIADLGAFEATVNPDGMEINPNPFDVAALWDGSALVADAGANALLKVDRHGNIDWVATLPSELVSTENIKHLFNCPAGPDNICGLPPMIPAQPVATSIAVGLDGYYYMGELKGFPAPTDASRVWRIKPTARHAQCGTSPDCTVIADGFTSIVDLAFGWDGTLHVVELDEASWFAIEVTGIPLGGSVNACKRRPWSKEWTCRPEASGLRQPIAATVDFRGKVHVVTSALIPGETEVITIP
jgi:hypothetical protein